MSNNHRRLEAFQKISQSRLVSIAATADFNDLDDVLAYAAAHHRAGCKVIEFVLASENALNVVNKMTFEAVKKQHPDMVIGVGTTQSAANIRMAKDAGADFAVSAIFHWDWSLVHEANKQDLLYFPGVGNLTEAGNLIAGTVKSPQGQTIHELLSGATAETLRSDPRQNITTFKLHPGGCSLIEPLQRLVINPFQLSQGMLPVRVEPSETIISMPFAKMREHATNPLVAAFGTNGTFGYSRHGQFISLIRDKNWDDISALTGYAMAVVRGKALPTLPQALREAACTPIASVG